MLKHHPKISKLWDKVPKIESEDDTLLVLDMKCKQTCNFLKEFSKVMKQGIINDAKESGRTIKDIEDFIGRVIK